MGSDHEDRLRHALGVSELGFWDWDVVEDEIYVSKQSHALLGYEYGELPSSGEGWVELLHPDDRGTMRKRMEALRSGEDEVLDVEGRFADKNGSWRWLRCRGRVVDRATDGKAQRVVGTHACLSRQKEIEEALRRSEERYRNLVEGQGEGIGIVDESERFIFANVAAERIFGVPHGTMIGRSLQDFLEPEEYEKILEQTSRRREGSLDSYEMSFTRHSDGKRRVLLVTATPRSDAKGDYLGAFGVFRDITERKEAEEALRESEERYRQLIESLPYGVGIVQHFKVVFVNRAALKILGFEDSVAVENLDPLTFITEAERQSVQGKVMALLEGELDGPLHYEAKLSRADGSFVSAEVYITAITYRGERAIQVVFMDISGRLKADEDRHRLEAQLLEARKLESIGRLAGGIAHEFNNLLTPVIINTHMALGDLGPTDPQRQDFEDILEAATRAKELTRQLLAFGRRQLLQTKVLNLNVLVEQWNETLRRLIREDVEIRLQLTRPLEPVRADPAQLQQVLVNLVLNARDSIAAGGSIHIATSTQTIEAGADPDLEAGLYVVLEVRDTGKGMDAETVRRIFDPFYSTKGPGHGTGLGLATVHGIVKQHGGHISVESELGKGSVFRIHLPAERVERPTPPRDYDRVAEGERFEHTVLVVEDESLLRRQVCRILARHGMTVLSASDGKQALELAGEHEGVIDLLVTDVVMPRLDGKELERRLREQRPELRVIFMSGYSDEVVGDHGLWDEEEGDVVFLAKPFTLQTLMAKVRTALADPAQPTPDSPPAG
jgi:PAS domain S-box-containing protein